MKCNCEQSRLRPMGDGVVVHAGGPVRFLPSAVPVLPLVLARRLGDVASKARNFLVGKIVAVRPDAVPPAVAALRRHVVEDADLRRLLEETLEESPSARERLRGKRTLVGSALILAPDFASLLATGADHPVTLASCSAALGAASHP